MGHSVDNAEKESGNAIGGLGFEQAVMAAVMHQRKASA